MKTSILGRALGLFVAAVVSLAAPGLAAAQAPAPSAPTLSAAQCEALKGGRWVGLPGAPTWIISATYHPTTAERRAYCDVYGYVNPTNSFGMYLPAEGWNGRYLVRGCGGSCGAVVIEGACGKHVRDGYACLQTDMGHRSDQIDNNWAANNLQGLVDFGYRSTHVTTVAGKAIATAFYDRQPSRSYFFACSTGGRQAMVEAQRFPGDFDGIVAVAPVNIGPFTTSNYVPPGSMNADAEGKAILSDLDIPLIYKAVMARCDLKDGVADGLFAPSDCPFEPGTLVCAPGKAAPPHSCLTAAQADLVRRFYAAGAHPGSELNWIGNLSRPPGPATEFAQERGDPIVADTLMNAGNPDLRLFKARGGKLLLTHGTTDLIVLPEPTVDYYQTATRVMGGPDKTQDFFRLFLIPGMDHCSGGDGAWGIDYLAAITDWVEHGKAPQSLVGIHPKLGAPLDYFGIDSRLLKPDQIAFSRPHFAYPLKAYYSGRGDPNLASSWVAAAKPTGRAAPAAATPAAGGALSARIAEIVTSTERAYVASGLPPANITARIAKAVRRELYLSNTSGAEGAALLDALLAGSPSAIVRPALESVRMEFAG